MPFDARPLWLFFLITLALLAAGCDAFSDVSAPSPRDRLVGEWVIERQVGTYEVVTNAEQTVLDPDAKATGAMTLQGGWYDDGRSRPIDEQLQYVRHTARPIYQGDGRAILISTDPVQNFETVRHGEDEGFVVQLSDVYDIQRYVFEPDGYLEGELVASYYEQYSGSPNLARDSLSAAPLPSAPLASSEPRLTLPALPFIPAEDGADTLHVDGQLRPAVRHISSRVSTEVDVERTPRDVLERQRITYTFTTRDSVFVTATVDGDTLRTAGTWQVEGDTLRIQQDDDTSTARIDLQPGHDGSPASLRMAFKDPLCRPDDAACHEFYEYTFGLDDGSLVRGTWTLVNDLVEVPTPNNASTRAARPSTPPGTVAKRTCSQVDQQLALCEPLYLLRGGVRSLRPTPH